MGIDLGRSKKVIAFNNVTFLTFFALINFFSGVFMSWDSLADRAERGPWHAGCAIVVVVLALMIPLGIVGWLLGWFTEAAQVAQEEFGPRAMLKKYEWFKDASATLDKKAADIKVYETRMKNLEEQYKGVARSNWPRDERETFNQWSTELAGIKASYNQLAASYNAAHSKINWTFADVGSVPAGGKPLPREFRSYEIQ